MQEMIEEWNYSAENLLYHFCCILRGGMGFREAREKMQDLKHREELDDPAVQYINRAVQLLPKIRGCSQFTSRLGVYCSHVALQGSRNHQRGQAAWLLATSHLQMGDGSCASLTGRRHECPIRHRTALPSRLAPRQDASSCCWSQPCSLSLAQPEVLSPCRLSSIVQLRGGFPARGSAMKGFVFYLRPSPYRLFLASSFFFPPYPPACSYY